MSGFCMKVFKSFLKKTYPTFAPDNDLGLSLTDEAILFSVSIYTERLVSRVHNSRAAYTAKLPC